MMRGNTYGTPKSKKKDTQNEKSDIYKKNSYPGVIIRNPASVFIESTVEIEEGAVIHPMVSIKGSCVIKRGAVVYSFCDLEDTVVGENTEIRSTFSIGATIGKNCTVGPFACLRKGAVIGDGCRVGDFVEIKNSVLENGVKCAHLSYIGDSSVGENTNVGCGVVFANYNGKTKRGVTVGNRVFIGCNSNLVAPVSIGDHAYIAAGSTVTEDVPPDSLCIARTRQVIKPHLPHLQ
ncbi:MAG: DapH/DapD/GlmU-related protein [Clostridia bacterium]|nr:DapH/DapD/GlmU-related protein [Clostridia bacterium]